MSIEAGRTTCYRELRHLAVTSNMWSAECMPSKSRLNCRPLLDKTPVGIVHRDLGQLEKGAPK